MAKWEVEKWTTWQLKGFKTRLEDSILTPKRREVLKRIEQELERRLYGEQDR